MAGASFERHSFAILFLALALHAGGCEREGALPSIDGGDVRFDVGLAGVVDEGCWNLFRMVVRNGGADFHGELEVRGVVEDAGGKRNDPVSYRMALEVPGGPGAPREVAFPVRPEGWSEVVVTLRQAGYARAFRSAVTAAETGKLRVLVITEKMRDLGALEKHIATNIKSEAEEESPALALEPQLRVLPPGGCSSIAEAYDPFQAILLHGTALADAPEGSIEALTGWVKNGGTLIAFAGLVVTFMTHLLG
jgi:hypothetical protein